MRNLKQMRIGRRSFTTSTLAGAALIGLRQRVSLAQSATPAATASMADGVQSDGTWAFFDDRWIEVVADAQPVTIVGQTSAAASLYDLGVSVAAIYGPSYDPDGNPDFQAGNLPLDTIPVLGNYGTEAFELDVEKFIEVDPDLVVDWATYLGKDGLWYLTGDAYTRVQELEVPTVGIALSGISILDAIHRFEELATILGADLSASDIVSAKELHASSETALKDAIAAKPGLSVLFISPTVDQVYVASPRYSQDLQYFADLGLDVLDHGTEDFFAAVSWEKIGDYKADLILSDARAGVTQPEEIAASVPVWNTLPAVQAGQVGPWYAAAPTSYGRLAPIMDDLTSLIVEANPDIV